MSKKSKRTPEEYLQNKYLETFDSTLRDTYGEDGRPLISKWRRYFQFSASSVWKTCCSKGCFGHESNREDLDSNMMALLFGIRF